MHNKSKYIPYLVIILSTIISPTTVYAERLSAKHLYNFAKNQNEQMLSRYRRWINMADNGGNTALCIALQKDDGKSYYLLKKYGASTNVRCMRQFSEEQTADVATDSSDDGKFLGMGKLGWGVLGVAAIGGGIAAASGGGGEGDLVDEKDIVDEPDELSCQHGIQIDKKCLCHDGYTGVLCENKADCSGYYQTCPEGYEKGDNICQSGKDVLYKCDIANSCEGYDYLSCPTGHIISAQCLSGNVYKYKCDDCADNWIKQNGNCYLKLECVNGYQDGDKCICDTEYEGMLCTNLKDEYIKKENVIGKTSKTNNSQINITNDKYADVYGLYARSSNKALVYNGDTGAGSINIKNTNNGNVYGIYADKSVYNSHAYYTASATGDISINNTGNGNIYGIYSTDNIYNAYTYVAPAFGTASQALGNISIKNEGAGNVFGMYSLSSAYNANEIGYEKRTTSGNIKIINNGLGNSFGIYATKSYNQSSTGQESLITLVNLGGGIAVGMYGSKEIENSGNISLYNLGNGTAVGVYADGAKVTNSGTITINRDNYEDYDAVTEKGGTAIGIYGANGSNITNSGTITITGADTAYGVYAEDDTVNIKNTGRITIDGNSNSPNAIKLNGGKLFQNGILEGGNLALNEYGGEVVASTDSKFVAKNSISGDLSVSDSVVTNGFANSYTIKEAIDAADATDLKLNSKSALFEAKLAENNSDIVMEMKDFNEVVADKSVAGFLSDNYNQQNNEKLFSSLKGMENSHALNQALEDMMGKEMFNRFAFEDLTMMREFNFDLNNKLFNNQEETLSTSGNISSWMFSGADNSQTKYSLNNITVGKNTVGLAVALTDINSKGNDGNNSRNDRMYQVAMPIGYQAYGFNFITTPSIGYSYGTYNRHGFNNSYYKGTVEKQMFGLMNEARYPFMAAGWNLDVALEFNVLGYHISGDEGSREYGLNIAEQNTYSAEAGIGLYANKEISLAKDSKLKLYNGIAVYHEFSDPYKMKIGMNGMAGTFTLQDENRSANRAIIRTGFDYTKQDLSLYGSLSSYIDRELQTNADLGLKYSF